MAYEAQERKDGGGQERTATLQLVIALSRAFQGDRTRRPATSRGARPWPDRIRGARGAVSQGRTAPGGDSRSDSCDGGQHKKARGPRFDASKNMRRRPTDCLRAADGKRASTDR